ncbi:MAG: site-2 protease family protein [Anaerolineae bacterium]|nr:MAG: site-2 protease family protein [Anaerolineae bacterium]
MLEPNTHSAETLTPLVERILLIEDVTMGRAEVGFAARYRGKLRKDSIEAYDELAKAVAPLRLTPVFRVEDERHVVLLMDGLIEPRPSKVWVNIVLAIVTAASLLLAGALYDFEGPAPADTLGLLGAVLPHLLDGLPFALSMASILGAHEFGHYLAARYHKTAVSLPYFLPMPFSPLGTLGAFIQLKAPPRNLRVLHDIGVAGPLAGLVVTIPILIIWIDDL